MNSTPHCTKVSHFRMHVSARCHASLYIPKRLTSPCMCQHAAMPHCTETSHFTMHVSARCHASLYQNVSLHRAYVSTLSCLTVPKRLTSPCICKARCLAKSKNDAFSHQRRHFLHKSIKIPTKYSWEVYRPRWDSKCPPAALTQSDSQWCHRSVVSLS